MKTVLITACTQDENGSHFPGEVIELPDGEADAYAEKQWGIIQKDAAKREELKKPEIETGESKMAGVETAAMPSPGKDNPRPKPPKEEKK